MTVLWRWRILGISACVGERCGAGLFLAEGFSLSLSLSVSSSSCSSSPAGNSLRRLEKDGGGWVGVGGWTG